MIKGDRLLAIVSRKLSPFVLLFGFYLVSYGHVSPGGGFQGGVVVASGVLLFYLGFLERRSVFSFYDFDNGAITSRFLSVTEGIAFISLLVLGMGGIVTGGYFLGNFFPQVGRLMTSGGQQPRAGFIFFLNVTIGLKVGAGISLIGMALFREMEK